MPNLKTLLASKKPVPVILNSGTNGLGVARSLGQIGLPSIILDCVKRSGFYSKYTCGLVVPDPLIDEKNFISFIADLGGKLHAKGFIVPASDKFLIPVSKYRDELEKYYLYPMSGWEVIENCIDKSKLYDIAEKENIPYPKTIRINNVEELNYAYKYLRFPFIVKPTITVKYIDYLKSDKVIIINKTEDIDHWVKIICEMGLGDIPIILQEMIPGSVNDLFTLTSYSNKKGKIIAYSTGYKIRQHPPNTGVITAGKVVHEPEVYKMGDKLIQALGFYGISNIEFKKDRRDGIFKLIEINPRPGKWIYSVYAAGINLPYLAYREIMGEELDFIGYTKKEIIWLVADQDILHSIYANKKYGYEEYALSIPEWLKSIRGKKVDGVFAINDLKPGLRIIYKILKSIISKRVVHLKRKVNYFRNQH